MAISQARTSPNSSAGIQPPRDTGTSRRALLGGGFALAGSWLLTGCVPAASDPAIPGGSRWPGGSLTDQPVVQKTLRAAPSIIDLGGTLAEAWAYNDTLPGIDLRANPGDLLRLNLDNQLPSPTTIHWHGMPIPNDVDGVPGLTQNPIQPGQQHLYEFTAPQPGTYFFHSHVGVQLDRGLYGPLIVDDPVEPGRYDAEWTVVLDDWLVVDGQTPEDMFRRLNARRPSTTGTQAVQLSSRNEPFFGDAGDIPYPLYLINGAVPTAPVTHQGRPGDRVRLRVINAASDTIFALALGGHRLTVTHTDGHPVKPHTTSALYLGMGERYDLLVTLGDGVFPLVAKPWNKPGHGLALVRTGSGSPPEPPVQLAEFTGQLTQGLDLYPEESSLLPTRPIDARATIELGGQANPYRWVINGAPFGQNQPLEVVDNDRLLLEVVNTTTRAHPVHLHGHTFALDNGLRKDTVLVPPSSTTAVHLDATNPGTWALHCQNEYHTKAGMMLTMRYKGR